MENQKYIAGYGYRLFKCYVRFLNEHLLYRHTYYLDRSNIPTKGEPCLIVANHQNCANDPLNLLLSLENDTHPYVIARGDAFSLSKALNKFFAWLGMLPAFRLKYEGADSLPKNEETLRIASEKLLEGNRLILYPEGIHYDKRWLGEFSLGYVRLAFQTAEKDGFQRDIKILPTANHYEDYFMVYGDMMIRYGKPVSLAPFYDLYKTKPRTAQREVDKLVRAQVEDMMLDIRDLDHYDELDWLRNSEFGVRYCREQGKNPNYLPDKLITDKQLVAAMKDWIGWDAIRELRLIEERLGINDTDLLYAKGWGITLLSLLAQIVLLPLWILTLYPNIFHYNVNIPFRKIDKMFTNSWRLIIPVVVGVPFFFIATVLVCGLIWGLWWQSIVWMLLTIYPLPIFTLREWKWMQRTWHNLKILCYRSRIEKLNKKRASLFEIIYKMIQKTKQ
ncbi:MAG: 1-acyl-sn-glycerol-3-phosphate acyltransferase [Paludibacteraceae bacterium]|nr:1-acyl-sn-glycerol-3-phosphate acyltransferase [Paludibacteraceae bacterium]